jgi:serine/threonine-protein kinase
VLSFGPYETIARIAAGGMGEVFIARRTGAGAFEKKVALKVLLPHLAHDREFVERFFDEARLVARMNHPNIVQIFDVGETDGRPWLAMALVEAVSLARLGQEIGQKGELLPLPLARLIATGLLEGLSYAHAAKGPRGEPLNVIHRDITPSNILVSREGAVLLTDFGIAKAATNVHHTKPGGLRGKLAYLAPESLSLAPIDQRSDLFSTATTLFNVLTGVSVFKKDTDSATMEAVRTAVHPRVTQLRPDVTPGMSAALERALMLNAADRFSTAKEMREAFCDGPVATAPELGEFVQRLCPTAFGAFRESAMVTPVGGGTSSLPKGAVPAAAAPLEPSLSDTLPHGRGRMGLGITAALVSFAAVVGGGLFLLNRQPQAPASDFGPVVVAPPPEREAPPPEEVTPVEPAPAGERTPGEQPAVHPTGRPVAARPRSRPTVVGKASPPSPEPLKVGYLTADAQPWATVLLDGKPLDKTPLSRFPVPSGNHTLVFRAADGREQKRPVNIEEGQVQTVRVDFAAP